MRKQSTYRTLNGCKGLWLLLLFVFVVLQTNGQTIGGNVYGGGEEGVVEGNSDVTIKNGKLGSFAAGGVTTGGNVYGGGNAGNLLGHTTVTLQGGNICGSVFGGAQQADVKKYTYVNIDGEHQVHDITVNRVYGGNDVSGVIGANQGGTEGSVEGLPFASVDVNTVDNKIVDNTFQSFILATKYATKDRRIFIGQMFGGGNGDYNYASETIGGQPNPYYGKSAPTVAKTYQQINGGNYGYVFAGGNNASITEKTVISINNTSDTITGTAHLNLANMSPINAIVVDNQVDWRLLSMGLNISTFHTGHQFNRVFGGNNKADMKIMPTWNLTAGNIHDLYGGGNEGRMTSPKGILLEIKEASTITAENVFGGCRRADVRPLNGSTDVSNSEIQLDDANYKFPAGLAARVLVRGGTIRNVYGGNDISGKVYGGNAVGVYTSILGDVYGGGNGSYAYTDNADLKDDLIWGDFYYDPGSNSVKALNAFRPNSEQVSLRLLGTADKKTIIGGSVYVGGNSATLQTDMPNPMVELKIGSYVIADNVFLGNNGENMVASDVLERYAGTVTKADMSSGHEFSSLSLTDADVFKEYMNGCAMTIRPAVVFDETPRDPASYIDNTSYFGSFFAGGNVGSMIIPGKVSLNFNKQVVIFNKLVGGCNSANVAAGTYNAAYSGGVLGSSEEQASYTDASGNIKDRLEMKLNGVKLSPMRWKVKVADSQPSVGTDLTDLDLATMDDKGVVMQATGEAKEGVTYYDYIEDGNGQHQLEYNVFRRSDNTPLLELKLATGSAPTAPTADDLDRRLIGGNVYGGCYNSGHVNGNVIINLQKTIHHRDELFDGTDAAANAKLYESGFNITARRTGVLLNEQGMDALGTALNVFGGGYGIDSEVWGTATVNLEKGYTFQIFGGGENGIIGKKSEIASLPADGNAQYSTFVNLKGTKAGDATTTGDETMPECEFIYGGGFKGDILGNTQVNLGNGRIFNSFAGSCDADIYGHTEIFMGRNSSSDADRGFPYVIDHIYGGNDLGGLIKGAADFSSRVREGALTMVYDTDVLTAQAYAEYQQGRVENIFGGAYGDYNYEGRADDGHDYSSITTKPYIENAFVNFKPLVDNAANRVSKVFGAGQGHKNGTFKDKMQNRSYVLVDVPQSYTTFTTTEFFGGGSYGGVGMGVTKAKADANESGVEASAVIDLVRGQVKAAYGGSYNQGITRRTIVNVPSGSTTIVGDVFGGAFGDDPLVPCDVYQSVVNYNSANARVNGALYGGNNSADRTLYTQVNVNAPVKQSNGYDGYVYGAGKGADTWAQYTEVNLNDGSSVYEVYGGGNAGKVLNKESLLKWKATVPALDLTLGDGYTDEYLESSLARTSELFTDLSGKYKTYDKKYNTNVIIKKGAYVGNYAYGGGYGEDAVVSGSTYIALLGGQVNKDIYAAGTSGSIEDLYKDKTFTASATAYVRGGTVRNVYGGGWKGAVGYHDTSTNETTNDVLGETHVVIGRTVCGDDSGLNFYDGKPTVRRNAYGGGEGGAVFGTANITLYNGYIGYKYNTETSAYEEHLNDRTADDGVGLGRLKEAGNMFGSGYADLSNADFTNVTLYGGVVRNSIYGGGEIGTVGRGKSDGTIYKGGATHVDMFEGQVKHDAFGGGRGFDNLNRASAIGTSGYVFGSTEIHVHGGEVGTAEGVADGYGNVFGGGNIGFVYSANGVKNRGGKTDGYYYDTNGYLTEDCSVVISPWTKVKSGQTVTLNDHTYTECQYVPAEDLNFLKNKNSDKATWDKVDDAGVIVHNAVFAGGNVSTGSDVVYANTKTVFGNATATVYDVYNRDLVTLGTEHVGGLYGDGNLTFVDGYRELNITNYGTDYYGMSDNISYEDYQKLTDRERAYFELKYKCTSAYSSTHLGKSVNENDQISEEDYNKMSSEEQAHWTLAGFCTIYAGRLLNTIQRADFCGLFGSRLVLEGAQDRVPSEVDYKPYTINRVGELSLNKSESQVTGDANPYHGCYFGIYSVVNHLGALTTDVDFETATRTYDNSQSDTYKPESEGQTYKAWKLAHLNERTRNNGTCVHKVALASGVHLEITTEESTKDNKVWGPITGVCQLDLIDVNAGLGGGYVYAKNIHGVRSASGNNHTILSTYNKEGHGHADGVTHKKWQYADATPSDQMQTSGNFIHNYKQIVDDCYPIGHSFAGEGASKAHYWFIRGEVYVYDQYISAYTGSASAYSQSINLPLTITPAAAGMLHLQDVKPNLYAYYEDTSMSSRIGTTKNKIMVNGVDYDLNEPINYWDWYLLSAEDKKHFVQETYITTEACEIRGGTVIPAGTVYLPSEYTTLKTDNPTVTCTALDATNPVPFDDVFHMTNNISHGTGYALTYDMSNPKKWDRYYTPETGSSIGNKTQNAATGLGAPTYKPTVSGVYGQHSYAAGDIIPDDIHDIYEALGEHKPSSDQATVVEAYVATGEVIYTIGETEHHVYKGSSISKTDYDQLTAEQKTKFASAHVCTSTIDLGNNEYIFFGDLLTDSEIAESKTKYKAYLKSVDPSLTDEQLTTKTDADFAAVISDAWYCTEGGKYGGNYYEESKNYRALEAWCSMNEDDRQKFEFNYDAFDVLIDPDYTGNTDLYDGVSGGSRIQDLYSPKTAVNYLASYNGSEKLTYTDESGASKEIAVGATIDNEAYEDIPNEKRHYKSITVDATDTYYIVKVAFTKGDVPYAVGSVLSAEVYNSLDDTQKLNVMAQELTKVGEKTNTYHFCREEYTVNEKGEGGEVTDINSTSYKNGNNVTVGTILPDTEYEKKLPNKQTNFTIHGTIPVETSTLYVAKQSDINDLNEDKIITVIYQYTYEESDASGNNTEEITEKHVVNIHIQFKSGVPEIGELQEPTVVLPGTTVGLKQPNVTPGAYEIIGGGWEMYTNSTDAEQHTNGVPYHNNLTKLYWYQDGYYVAYYAKSYLGKTYSNEVQFAVANYHDLDEVMQDKDHHMYVDHPGVDHNSKIYIDNRECASDDTKNELDLLKDFYDLSLLTSGEPTGEIAGHALLNSHVAQCNNLDFILRSDMTPMKYTDWTPIGDAGKCFEGTLHGDGYTVGGLNKSLFGYLCGSVYNLGVTGSFTGAGVADQGDGYVENCWISTTGKPDGSVYAVFGNPTGKGTPTPKQIVNCYYPSSKGYKTTASEWGVATAKSEQAFYNGEVAYDLNGFYLYKRYCDPNVNSGTEAQTYKFFTVEADNTLSDAPQTEYYADNMSSAFCSSGYNGNKYVEDRYADGDFIYAAGVIPEGENEHYWSADAKYYPIWPDDYIFFGQKLTYGHADDQEHQPLPSRIMRNGERLLEAKGNRVYRAPAYFQSSVMQVAHFNPDAYLAEKSKDGSRTAYPNMTAIDFTGHNDVKNGYKLGTQTSGFYPPLLDDGGLHSIVNIDETQNLLVYIPQPTATETDAVTKTNTVVTEYLPDAAYAETHNDYRTVDVSTAYVRGHRVLKDNEGYTEGTYTAGVDHLLVDRQDFFAPIAYNFASGKRMWYQRTPDTYVDTTKGWEGISIPFSAELVTTQDKGEITHFYAGSATDGSDAKIGHEYWLREFQDGGSLSADGKVFTAVFNYPGNGSENKTCSNTFLWDYYYSQSTRQDKNTDTYQQYYNTSRNFSNYGYSTAGKPYIIGFPGVKYYEFDLSGQFVPLNTYASIDQLSQQVITFASETGAEIAVSDTELAGAKVTEDGYTFTPNYLSADAPAGTSFLMQSDGSAFKKTTSATATIPFRPYFTGSAGARRNSFVDEIVFTNGTDDQKPAKEADSNHYLSIHAKHGAIVAESHMKEETQVSIVSVAGVNIATFTIKPGETIETPVYGTGVYIVNGKKLRVDGR